MLATKLQGDQVFFLVVLIVTVGVGQSPDPCGELI